MFNTLGLFFRSLLFAVGYYLVTIVMSTIFIILFPLLSHNVRHVSSTTWCKFILGWLRICCGITYKLEGRENITGAPVVIIANHQSEWETLLLYSFVSPISPIIKKELLNIPFYGWALRLTNPIAIDRKNPREAGRSILTQGVDRLNHGNTIIMFPEGARLKPGEIKKFSRGGAKLAIAAGVPLVLVAHNAGYHWPPRSFIKQPGQISVKIGKPIDSVGRNASELTNEAEQWIRNQLSIGE